MTPPTDADLIAFVYDEARTLDELRFDDWLGLFAPEARYWMPLKHGQREDELHASLLDEDLLLLKIRVERLKGARTYSQQPRSRCHHLLAAPRVTARDDAAGRWQTHTAFHYVETRGDEQVLYAGWATHRLQRDAASGALRIAFKRIDLVNCDAAFGNIQLFM